MNWKNSWRSLIVLATVATTGGSSHAEPIMVPYDIHVASITVFNDRIGYSRFFFGANSDRLRVSAFVSPSRDSDWIDLVIDDQAYRSSNGSATIVTLSHPDSPNFERRLDFVGLTSTGGGGRNEFTTTFDLANPQVAERLADWDATPFTITVRNPYAQNDGLITEAPDYDSSVLPPFVTDLSVTGSGINPRLD